MKEFKEIAKEWLVPILLIIAVIYTVGQCTYNGVKLAKLERELKHK